MRSCGCCNFNPRPPRGGRQGCALLRGGDLPISIHVLREEDDVFAPSTPSTVFAFQSTSSARRTTRCCSASRLRNIISIHVLREEDDLNTDGTANIVEVFQSTSSARRTTASRCFCCPRQSISIHVLREEDDVACCFRRSFMRYFNPRPPRGGRPGLFEGQHIPQQISIHVLREEDDFP